MSEDNRATLTGALWFFCAIVLAALFISAAAQGELTAGHMLLAVVILALAVAGTLGILRWKGDDAQEVKAKRQSRVDNLLRDMTDDELGELRQRLSADGHKELPLTSFLDDDGELSGSAKASR